MSRIVAVAPVLPPHRYAQAEVTAMVRGMVLPGGVDDTSARGRLLDSLHAHSGIEHRHMALPLEDYPHLDGFTGSNDAFIRIGTDMAIEAVTTALKASGLTPSEVDVVFSTTITGLAAPSLEARLVGPLGLRPDVKRVPIFGLGCVGGAAGIARVHDHLVGHPDDVAVLLSVELCSLTLQRDDTSTANLVASGLFGDGAAAVVVVGERRAAELAARGTTGPDVVSTRSRFYPDTAGIMGWDVGGTGFKIVLAPRWPTWSPPTWAPTSTRSWPTPATAPVPARVTVPTTVRRSRAPTWASGWSTPAVPRCCPPSSRPWTSAPATCTARARSWRTRGTCPPRRCCTCWSGP